MKRAAQLYPPATPSPAALDLQTLEEVLLAVVNAVRDYLPPDGIDAQECLNRIIGATDNPTINPIIAEIENGRA